MATGSYEESLLAEGTPVIPKRRLSRDGVDGDLGGFDVLRPVPNLRRAGRTARLQRSRRRARREDEGRDRDTGVRGSVASAPWEDNAHAHHSGREAQGHGTLRWMTTRRSVLGCRETSGSPEMLRGALFSAGRPRRESGDRIWELTRCGCTQFDWVAEVGQTHRASSSPDGRKACWWSRALAGRKSAAPPDAGHGWVDGETVRVREAIKPVCFSCDLRVSACRLSIRRKAFSGSCPPCFHRQGDVRPSDSEVNSTSTYGPQGHVSMQDSTSGGHGIRLGCASG